MPSFQYRVSKHIFSAVSNPFRQSTSLSTKLHRFSTTADRGGEMEAASEQQPPDPIPNRPLRGQRLSNPQTSNLQFLNKNSPISARRGESPSSPPLEEPQEVPEPPQAAEEADQIFKKMKETGLIPNAVAMLDELCKDGLVQEAMKLFGSMREKGTIPEVKFEDAKRIFRKMQSNGIVPNAFSYTVLIQGLYRANNLEDAAEFCSEMLEAGHSPNVATFVRLIDAICKEKDMEKAESVIGKLKQKGYLVNEKAVKEFLDKKAPFSPRVWEAIFGKNKSQRMF
ncbi:unnamed protein product [Malus baccata var. baccata]